MGQRVPRVLYHYCSLSTFKSIFDNKSIWLSDIRRSNDSLELQWIMNQCRAYMLLTWAKYISAAKESNNDDAISLEHINQFQELYDLAKNYDADDDEKNWVFCLSEKADDLGQWRGYADDGKGISIGFNTAFLKRINIIGKDIQTASVNFQFSKVHYSEKDVADFFQNTAQLSRIDGTMSAEEVIQHIKYALVLSYASAPLYKKKAFKEEREWRIAYSMFLGDIESGQKPGITKEQNKYTDDIILEKYEFSQRGDTLVSHLEMEMPNIKRAIHSIIIGPKANVTPSDVKLYLMSIGLLDSFEDESIKVSRSEISYR